MPRRLFQISSMRYHHGMAKLPIIGVTVDSNEGEESAPFPGAPPNQTLFWLKKAYCDAVEKSGGVAILLPVTHSPARIKTLLSLIDGLIVSGGDFDIDPSLFGERILPTCGALKPERTAMEMKLFREAHKAGIPTLGVCGGHQIINVVFKGTLYQDIPTQLDHALRHEQKPLPSHKPSHTVRVGEGTLLHSIVKRTSLKVNSTHHQGVRDRGGKLVCSATSSDGVAEAIELAHSGGPFMLGVQWHPELLYDHDEPSRLIYKRFIAAARAFLKRRA